MILLKCSLEDTSELNLGSLKDLGDGFTGMQLAGSYTTEDVSRAIANVNSP